MLDVDGYHTYREQFDVKNTHTHRHLTLMCQARSLLDRSSTFHADRLQGVQVPSSAPPVHRCHCSHAFLVLAPLDGSRLRSWRASLRNEVSEDVRLILRVNTAGAAGTTRTDVSCCCLWEMDAAVTQLVAKNQYPKDTPRLLYFFILERVSFVHSTCAKF